MGIGFNWDANDYLAILLFSWTFKIEASNGALFLLNLQVIPAFEEAVSGMALGGIRRCCIFFLKYIAYLDYAIF